MFDALNISSHRKQILKITVFIFFGVLASFLVESLVLGASAFPIGGKEVGGHFLVEGKGEEVLLTRNQYWISYIHGWTMVVSGAVYFMMLLYCSLAGKINARRPMKKTRIRKSSGFQE